MQFLLALQSIDAIKDRDEECNPSVFFSSFLLLCTYMVCLLVIQDKYYDDHPRLLSWSFIRFSTVMMIYECGSHID